MMKPDELHLVFDAKTLDYIANVLGQRPYIEVQPVLANIALQVAQQQSDAQQQSKAAHMGPQTGLNGAEGIEPQAMQ